MPIALDHVVIVVPSLAEGVAAFEAAGFTVRAGGRHEELPTENALVAFADGTYLELLAARDPDWRPHLRTLASGDGWARRLHEATALGRRFLPLLAGRDGVADAVLHGAPLARLAREARARGHVLTGPTPMRRLRPDGVSLEWQLLLPERTDLPFLIEDRTPRAERVPHSGEAVTHANGATGIAEVAIGAASVPEAALALADLCGLAPRVGPDGATGVLVGAARLRLDGAARAGAHEVAIAGARALGGPLGDWGVRTAAA